MMMGCELGQPVSVSAFLWALLSLFSHLCSNSHRLVKQWFLCGKNDSKRKLADISLDKRREGAKRREYKKVAVLRKKEKKSNKTVTKERKNKFHGSSHFWHQQANQPYALYRNKKNIFSLYNLLKTLLMKC